ncbi:MAG TPA: preprotein translocase subunit SecY [Candidatus Bathyarchaeia archaeon]|nr:preprotein translocase subunit SecY [Candidatus Bathyarchaeia archaeon]
MVRFIELFKPIARFFPDIKSPDRKVAFNEKIFWTVIALIVYFVMSQVPLYGVTQTGANDPLGALRVIFASNRGTLMELGIGPIVTAGLILQVLAGSKMINLDMSNSEDRSLFTSASKILSVVMTIFEASAYIIGGTYGTLKVTSEIVILLQLVAAGLIVLLLDELLQKGWGLGSGISLFIAAGVASSIWWDSIAPMGPMGDGHYLGAVVAFVQSLLGRQDLRAIFTRQQGLPDMVAFLTTVGVFIIIIYLNGMRVEVPVSYARYRGFRGKFPIKLFYVSNIPVIFAAALFGNIYFISQLIWQKYNSTNTNFWLNLLGKFVIQGQQYQPSGGLVYYVVPPRSLALAIADPLRALIYTILLVTGCVFFAVTWVEVGGMDSKAVARQLLDSGMQIEGFRRSEMPIRQILERYIPTVTILGAIIIGLIAAGADFLGAFGSGTGILLTVGIIEQYYQILVKEKITEMYPAARGILGE